MIRVRVIPAADLAPDLIEPWRRLQAACPLYAGPYFCPEYTQLVAAVRPRVCVGVAEEAGRVVGFFPFERRRGGVGGPVGGPVSDYQAFIVDPAAEWTAADLVRQCGLRVWDFDHLLRRQSPFCPHATGFADSPILDLTQGYPAYRAQRRQETSQLNRIDAKARKLAAAAAPLRYVAHSAAPADFAAVVRWKSAQYQRTGAVNSLAFPWVIELLQRILSAQTPTFAGMLTGLYAGDRLIAANLGMRSATVWHSWFPTFDLEFEKHSPGLVLFLKMAEDAPNHGLTVIDLGRGEARYKTELANAAIPLTEGSVELPSLARTARRLRRGVEAAIRGTPGLRQAAHYPAMLYYRLCRRARFR